MLETEGWAEIVFRTRCFLAGLRSTLPGGITHYTPRCVQPKHRATPLRYYSLWIRHLVYAEQMGITSCPKNILELGPGDSLGAGLSALLSGADHLNAIDRFALTSLPNNVEMFDELVSLFNKKAEIDSTVDRPHLHLETFPAYLFAQGALDHDRLQRIRSHLHSSHPDRLEPVVYDTLLKSDSDLPDETVDFAFSHSVLEYIENPSSTHRLLLRLLKPGGVVSHFIDYSSIGFARRWDGHWAYSDLEWRIIKGRRPYIVQRLPHSKHVELLESSGFQDIHITRFEAAPETSQSCLAKHYKLLSEEDRRTCYALIQARKPCSTPVEDRIR